MGERINKYLARSGIASRREAERFVCEGRVTVNGEVVRELGTRVDPLKDHVRIDGKLVRMRSGPIYILYNKPKNVVCTMQDPEGRPCVGDFLKRFKGRPIPAGRLDFDSEGLLLCTNDGDLIQRLLHPRYHVQRVYHVKVKGGLDPIGLKKISEGVVLNGRKTLPAQVHVLKKGDRNVWISLSIAEGRNQQVRRMLEAVGHPVLKLKRIAFGPLTDKGIPLGGYRTLLPTEVQRLKAALTRD